MYLGEISGLSCSNIFYLSKKNEDTTKFDWIEVLKAPFYLGGPFAEFFGGIVLKAIWKKNLNNLKKIIEQ